MDPLNWSIFAQYQARRPETKIRRCAEAHRRTMLFYGKGLPFLTGSLYYYLPLRAGEKIDHLPRKGCALATRDTVYFISDAHLGEHGQHMERRKEERLCSFFDHIGARAECLYVVGDLFDFWFEYRQVVPSAHHRILHRLADLVGDGIRVVYLAGNHDFWLDDFFPREIGVETSREPLSVRHQGISLYVAHGDGLAQPDRGYRFLKRILRHPLNIRLYRLIHPDVGIPLARLASASSRAYTDQKALELVNEYERAAQDILSRGFDAVVLGHSHYPSLRSFGGKIYLNIGDWITHFTYGRLRDGKLTLQTWEAEALPTG